MTSATTASWVGVRWARASAKRGHFCTDESHAETDYAEPKHGKRMCGTCFPRAALRKAGGLDECRPDAQKPKCPVCHRKDKSTNTGAETDAEQETMAA